MTGNTTVLTEVLAEAADVFRNVYVPNHLTNSSANVKRGWAEDGRVCCAWIPTAPT